MFRRKCEGIAGTYREKIPSFMRAALNQVSPIRVIYASAQFKTSTGVSPGLNRTGRENEGAREGLGLEIVGPLFNFSIVDL